jgi:site-specific DNA-methyltransferase (adenine-specific)
MTNHRIYFGDNLPILKKLEDETINLIYIDPPFNTGKKQRRTRIRTDRSETGDRIGFAGNRYQTIEIGTQEYIDSFGSSKEYLDFLKPRLIEAYRILSPHGSLYFHLDYREVHYCKVFLLDEIFGRECFLNEIIWAYDFGGRPKNKWPPKHDNILVYVKDPENYVFNYEEIERIPYMSPGLVGEEKARKGKLPTDTWWHTIVPTNSKERTGYPTQKPLAITNRIIQASSKPGDTVLDFFAGSGSVGESCIYFDRKFILIDNNPQALKVMAQRFKECKDIDWVNFDPEPYLI